jgi:two-component system, NtrC family, response regulator AtoC
MMRAGHFSCLSAPKPDNCGDFPLCFRAGGRYSPLEGSARLRPGDGVSRAKILIVDDDEKMAGRLVEQLGSSGYDARYVTTPEAALQSIEERSPDLAILDVRMPGMSGIDLLTELRRSEAHLPVIVMTGYATIEDAVEAMRRGAFDYVEKPFRLERLLTLAERALETNELRREVARLKDELEQLAKPMITGTSRAMERVCTAIRDAARARRMTVLIHGETGTGKELVARAIHHASGTGNEPFVAVNCGSLNDELVGAELFGYEGGAFTGADPRGRPGLFREAEGGTILLDEIGDMPLNLQPALLRALQERTVRPVGSSREHPFDVRVIASTHRDLTEAVREKQFREDLYYRLKVMRIEVPPLRERREDVLVLAYAFVARANRTFDRSISRISDGAIERLRSHPWPGNVRELKNTIEVAAMTTSDDTIRQENLATLDDQPPVELGPALILPDRKIRTAERLLIVLVLKESNGNIARSARELGINRSTLYKKMDEYDLRDGNRLSV